MPREADEIFFVSDVWNESKAGKKLFYIDILTMIKRMFL